MPLQEQDTIGIARSLDDYESLRVTDTGGSETSGYWLTVTDDRGGFRFEIASGADYWDFVPHFASGRT